MRREKRRENDNDNEREIRRGGLRKGRGGREK